MRLHLWCPELFERKGGIQVFSTYLLQALQTLYPQINYDIFLKHDRPAACDPFTSLQTRFHTAGQYTPTFRTPAFALQLLTQGLRQHPNLVLTTHLNFTRAAYALKQLTHIPYWTIAHGIEAWDIQNPALQQALQGAGCILAVSHYTRDRLLLEQDLDPQKVVVLPNTFDSNRFQIAPKPTHLLKQYRLSADQPIILTVARLEPSEQYKGYDTVLAALPQIRRVIPNVHYLLVGKGSEQTRIEQLIQEYQLQDSVTLTGFVSDEELCDYYNLCDVFAMPSKKEGFGIVYLEALACGKPTIGGNQDGATDALCNGELGALVDPDDIDEITQTLIQIIQRTYPNPLMYQPELLRQKVIEIYGFDVFKQTLDGYLNDFFSHSSVNLIAKL